MSAQPCFFVSFGLATLILLCICNVNSLASNDGCEGNWRSDSAALTHGSKHYGLRSAFQEADPGSTELREQLCPAETLMHNCYFHNTTRARLAERRIWVLSKPHVSGCLPFWPASFLHSIRNRHLLLLGDSTTMQLWSSLVCSLFAFTPHQLEMQWHNPGGGTSEVRSRIYNNRTCPYEEDKHCHILKGSIQFPSYHATVSFEWMDNPPTLAKMLKYSLSARDVVVMNFGLHYNDEAQFKQHLSSFADEMRLLLNRQQSVPLLFFRESLPTHFSQSMDTNGYFITGTTSKNCAPYKDVALASNMSWRNAHFGLLPAEIKLIRTFNGLASQYDAHVDGDSKITHFDIADCVHWCNPSGVFEYVKMIMYNAIRRALQHK